MVKNSCIFYLVNDNPIHIRRLYNSLECLQKNFLDEYPYPVVIGHEGISQTVIDNIKHYIKSEVYLYNVNLKMPDYTQEILNQIPERFKGHWDENAFFSIGYRHMCRFFSGEIYKDPFFEKVKYLLRLDCDSYFTNKVTYDIFKRMEETKSVYGTVGEDTDMDYVVEGFGDVCMSYFKDSYNFSKPTTMFQTHFDLTDVQWIKNSDYMDFYDFIDSTGNIYIKRWGDAIIKYQGMVHTAGSGIYLFSDLPYKHGGDL